MLPNAMHGGGPANFNEILFNTPFGYMFPELARSENCRLPTGPGTQGALLQLGAAMGEPGTGTSGNSGIPSVHTYLGQFIDHDITALTDRETEVSSIGGPLGQAHPFLPLSPDEVVATLKNGRRPQLDLDSLYGDGPSLVSGSSTTADPLYSNNRTMLIKKVGNGVDLPRHNGAATIADGRNDENLNVSQLHAAFIAFHNSVMGNLAGPDKNANYIRARQLVRWAYQCAVVNDYLKNVCDRNIVEDVLANGPRYFGPGIGGEVFMPLEFSVAAFRFGHSMVRGSYKINSAKELSVTQILKVSALLGGNGSLNPQNLVDWKNYVSTGTAQPANKARKIDPLLANGLFDLEVAGTSAGAMMRHLAQRNLLRGYLLSIPTGQCIATAMGIEPLSESQITDGQPDAVNSALAMGGFTSRSPLWYYVLREAEVQNSGNSLGAVGSRLVAETIIGLLKQSPNSFLNSRDSVITETGIKVPGSNIPICTIAGILQYAGVYSPGQRNPGQGPASGHRRATPGRKKETA